MAKLILLNKTVTINGQEYPKGEKLKVSDELAAELIADGSATAKDERKSSN